MTDPTTIRTLKPAAQNPWYLLATLYGEPKSRDQELQAKNRVVWNRYYSSTLTDERRDALKDQVDATELVPFYEEELAEIKHLFRSRARSVQIEMPGANQLINFRQCQFDQHVYFSGFVFGAADFSNALFSRRVYFRSATFSKYADFGSATFSEVADFRSATFSGYAKFGSATFHMTAIFTNSKLKAPTDFADSQFLGEPPRFHGAKLHEDTVWRGVTWPTAPTDPDKAGRFTDAYERLKQEMDRLKKHEDELMFFAKELACRRVARGQVRGLPIGAYGVLCHYGQSYMLPLGWLIALILVGAVQFWPVLNWDFLLALGVSTANTLGPLGLRKEMMDAGTLPLDLSRWLRFLSGTQMVIGLILLFLIGLGLRNRFRMK